jgi:outer membrane protein OmpA-like peptidoglycan-associated protein
MRLLLSAVAGLLVLAGCSGGKPDTPPAAAAAPTDSGSSAGTGEPLPPGALPGLDDLNDDGTPDPTCGTQDFGAGLVLRIPCTISNPNQPEEDTRLVKDSLYRLPAADADLTHISGSLMTARDTTGKRVFIFVFNSDNLFATGSDVISEANTLDAVIRLINEHYAGGAIQARGHTDQTGTAANNQALSERRAQHVRDYLVSHDTKASGITSVGLGSTRPLVEETNPDGSVSAAGRSLNRRVEIVIRLP